MIGGPPAPGLAEGRDAPDGEEMTGAAEAIDLRVEGIEKSFGTVRAVRDCNLTVRRGEMVALLGPSGCGKTTLLNIIAGFESCDSGDLWLRGESLRGHPPEPPQYRHGCSRATRCSRI